MEKWTILRYKKNKKGEMKLWDYETKPLSVPIKEFIKRMKENVLSKYDIMYVDYKKKIIRIEYSGLPFKGNPLIFIYRS